MKDLYILGAGGCGREVLSMMLDAQAIQGQRWNIKGFLDDTEAPLHGKDCALPVVGTIMDYSPKPNDVLLMGIAEPHAKERLVNMLKARGAAFASFIHPGPLQSAWRRRRCLWRLRYDGKCQGWHICHVAGMLLGP